MAKTYTEAMIDIKNAYPGEWPATSKDIATWAVTAGHWEMDSVSQIKACAKALSVAMRTMKHEDPQGRHVRTMAAARRETLSADGETTQEFFWADVRASQHYEHVAKSFRFRSNQVEGDIHRLREDIESYNANYLPDGYPAVQLELKLGETV